MIRLLEEHFARLVSYEFTAGMEDVLDEIAGGRKDRNSELAEFYFGNGEVEGLHKLVNELGDIDAKELATFPIGGADSGDRSCGSAATAPTSKDRATTARPSPSAPTCPTTCRPTS